MSNNCTAIKNSKWKQLIDVRENLHFFTFYTYTVGKQILTTITQL